MGEAVSGPPDRLNPYVKPDVSLNAPIESFDGWFEAASFLTQTRAYKFPRYLPSVILLKLTDGDEARVYSLIANRVYASQDTILFQDGQALPHLYTMSLYPTVIGGFPNYFMEMDLSQAGDFLRGLRDVRSLADWNSLRDRYGILRNDARLWATYDWSPKGMRSIVASRPAISTFLLRPVRLGLLSSKAFRRDAPCSRSRTGTLPSRLHDCCRDLNSRPRL
jgi:hypothetical protein